MTLRSLKAILALALAFAAPAAFAGGFSTTNVQLLQGYNFDKLEGNPDDGKLTTLTLNTFSTWEHGDSFAFVDMTRGSFGGSEGSSVYAEWHPRLFLNDLLGQKEPAFGVIRNWGVAGEVNMGNNFYAYLGGVGFDFVAPKFWVLGLNVYYRYDQYARHQYQISPYWTVPFALGKVPFVFTGFVDINGTKYGNDQEGIEIWAQPELLVDVLPLLGGPGNRLLVGTEVAIHQGYAFGETSSTTSVVPQVMVQWTVY